MSRASDGSQELLIRAAGDLIVDVGPRAATVRDISRRAGVNHGLVHHYFRGKDQLLRAAMLRLLEEHRDFVKEQGGGRPIPPPMLLLQQSRYMRAVAHCVLDGRIDLASWEVEEGISVPRRALDHISAKRGQQEPSVELKAGVCLAMAMEMGWALLEPFLFAVTGVSTSEEGDVRDLAKTARKSLAEEALRA